MCPPKHVTGNNFILHKALEEGNGVCMQPGSRQVGGSEQRKDGTMMGEE